MGHNLKAQCIYTELAFLSCDHDNLKPPGVFVILITLSNQNSKKSEKSSRKFGHILSLCK